MGITLALATVVFLCSLIHGQEELTTSKWARPTPVAIYRNYNRIGHLHFNVVYQGKEKVFNAKGLYGLGGPTHNIQGRLIHILNSENERHGCDAPVNRVPHNLTWIALIERGKCKFYVKLMNAIQHNASAAIVYDSYSNTRPIVMQHKVDQIVNVFVVKSVGQFLARIVDNGTVTVTIHRLVKIAATTNSTTNSTSTPSKRNNIQTRTTTSFTGMSRTLPSQRNRNIIILSLSIPVLLISLTVCVILVLRVKGLNLTNHLRIVYRRFDNHQNE